MKTIIKILAAGVLLAAVTCTEKGSEPPEVSARTCGICHKLPPVDNNHVLYFNGNITCGVCHQGYSADSATKSFFVNDATHMNGIKEGGYIPSQNTCNMCHDVPPKDPQHSYHIDTLHYRCSYCHSGYAADSAAGDFAVNTATHMNGDTDVVFSSPWNDSGRAAYDIGLRQCSNVYCHGAIPQGKHATVSWFGGSPINMRCYACHDSASLATYHYGHGITPVYTAPNERGGTVNRCYKCHGTNLSDTAYMVVPQRRADPVKHIDGVFDRGTCRNCHLTWTTWQEYLATLP